MYNGFSFRKLCSNVEGFEFSIYNTHLISNTIKSESLKGNRKSRAIHYTILITIARASRR